MQIPLIQVGTATPSQITEFNANPGTAAHVDGAVSFHPVTHLCMVAVYSTVVGEIIGAIVFQEDAGQWCFLDTHGLITRATLLAVVNRLATLNAYEPPTRPRAGDARIGTHLTRPSFQTQHGA